VVEVTILATINSIESEESQVAFVRERGVNGLLIVSSFEKTVKYMKDLQHDNFPFVMISKKFNNMRYKRC